MQHVMLWKNIFDNGFWHCLIQIVKFDNSVNTPCKHLLYKILAFCNFLKSLWTDYELMLAYAYIHNFFLKQTKNTQKTWIDLWSLVLDCWFEKCSRCSRRISDCKFQAIHHRTLTKHCNWYKCKWRAFCLIRNAYKQ